MWKCDRCDKVFQRRLHVAQHRRTHSEYRPYKCLYGHCLQSFPILSQLQIHQRHHIDHRRYHCRICRVRFLRQNHLEHHKCQPHHCRVRKCHICSATFLRILSLANHIYEQHPKVVKRKRLQCWQILNRNKKKSKFKVSDVENAEDSKILLKITLGKSMTIISPSKKSQNTHDSKKKLPKKKSKKKHKKEDKKQEKKGIILSIKKGMVNLKDKRNSVSKTKQTEKINGLLNTEYKLREQKSELKLTIKACPDLTVSPSNGENYKVLEKSESRSSLKLEKRTSSRTEIDTMENMVIDGRSPQPLQDSGESKVRNGIVITKDKTGKFLAEQLPAVKSKKRENVFESFNDVGIWKVLESPRDRPNDILKLKLSPQKPARLESTLEEACAYNASKYLDIPVNSVKAKGEASGEDSDILELLPSYEKESDGGINNVNDSGIEVLSSSSCNRSNGNSVRSVIMEDNSPTYFNTEDSLLSLDSPLTEGMNKSEHSICHKCGGLIIETNNNTRSPGKCRCNPTNLHSPFEMPISPVKTNLHSLDVNDHNVSTLSSEQGTDANLKLDCSNEKLKEGTIKSTKDSAEDERSDGEDSDIMIITFDKNQNSSEEGKSRLKLKLRSKDQPKPEQKFVEERLMSPHIGKGTGSVSPNKLENSKCPEIKSRSANVEIENKADRQSDSDEKDQSKTIYKTDQYHENESLNTSIKEENADIKSISKAENAGAPAIIVREVDDIKSISYKPDSSSPYPDELNKQIRKKPLFKSKKSDIKNVTNALPSLPPKENLKQTQAKCNDEKTVQNKKPLFKKRTLSADGKSEQNAKKPCFKTQMSVPDITLVLEEKNDNTENIVKQKVNSDQFNKLEMEEKDSEISEKAGESKVINEVANIQSKTTVSKLCTIGLDEDDSLQDFSGNMIENVEEISTPVEKSEKPVSFDLYQQQFLSFISNTLSLNKSDKKQHADNQVETEKDKPKLPNGEKSEFNENDKLDGTNNGAKTIEESCGIKNSMDTGDKVDERNKEGNEEIEIRNIRTGKKVRKKLCSKSKNSCEKKVAVKAAICESELGAYIEDDKTVNKKLTEETNKIEKSDSLSWLTIFGDSTTKDNHQKNERENAVDVMRDLSENLAEINKKIDVSEDDDTNSLDVDDVFQVENLSSLQPKNEINFNTSQTRRCAKENFVKCSKACHDPPYKRKQTAKRSVGKFKSAKRKVESDYEYSDESSDAETIDLLSNHPDSDPDFNPFMDSDDDFVKAPQKRRVSRTCVRLKKRTVNGSEYSDSDDESKCSEADKFDSESQISRSKRTKQGRKSCCPCCIGSPRKSIREHSSDQQPFHRKEAYKLPRNHKQFVRSTLKLLQLQEKIHTLFLTLFPECAEMISHSNIGTEEFESLIDDVLNGLEDTEIPYSSVPHSVNYLKKEVDSPFESCPVSNIEMPFTASGSATRTSEIDLVNTSGEDKCATEVCLLQTAEHKSLTTDFSTSSVNTEEIKYKTNTAGKELDAGISWQQPSLFSHTFMAPSASSSSSLKFENNTLTGTDESTEEHIYENVISHPVAVSESSLAFAQESVTAPVASAHYSTANELNMMNVDPVSHLDVFSHAEPLHNMNYYASEVDSDPVIQSEITITLDLNAARVSLCRSPKNCLQRLHNQVIKLTKYFFPKIEFKNYFYKNIDNLEFLLDLMLEANLHDNAVDTESENEMLDEEISDKWHHVHSNEIDIIEAPIIKEDDTVKVNFLGLKNDVKTEEREPLFVKCSDLFEQEIKYQRESLKKDVFSLEEDKTEEETWKSAEEVLNSISSLKKMAKRTEMAQRTRRPRDCRLRKRSADEKRTLFVQEKLQNSQNSSIVCNTKTRSGNKAKAGRKASRPENSKKRFLSELNLSDRLVSEKSENDNELLENTSEKMNGHILKIDKQSETKNKNEINLTSKSEKVALSDQITVYSSKDKYEVMDFQEDTDSLMKASDKNIFELMQPS